MRRWLFIILSLLSLTLAMWTAVRWIKSYRVASLYCRSVGDSRYSIAAAKGGIHFQKIVRWPDLERRQWHSRPIDPVVPWQHDIDCWEPLDQPTFNFIGFSYGAAQLNFDGGIAEEADELGWGKSTSFWVVRVPFWFVLAIAVGVTWLLWRCRGRRVWRKGLCTTCGYDLRATPRRCPECGCEAESDS